MIKQKKAILLLSIFLVAHLWADESDKAFPSLSSHSKKQICKAAITGGLVTLAGYMGIHWLCNEQEFPPFNENTKKYILLPCIAALITAVYKAMHTPEQEFQYAKEGINALCQNQLLNLLYSARGSHVQTFITQIKGFYYRDKFPLYVAFLEMDSLHNRITRYYDSLKKIIQTDFLAQWQRENKALQEIACQYIMILKDSMQAIKEDPGFLIEANAYALEISANAAQSHATAAWCNALRSNNQIYIYNT